MIIGNLLVAPSTTVVTVTNIVGKPDKEGRFQVFGHRTADLKMRLLTFWVFRKEAEEIARGISTCAPGEAFEAEIDKKAWAFAFTPPIGVS